MGDPLLHCPIESRGLTNPEIGSTNMVEASPLPGPSNYPLNKSGSLRVQALASQFNQVEPFPKIATVLGAPLTERVQRGKERDWGVFSVCTHRFQKLRFTRRYAQGVTSQCPSLVFTGWFPFLPSGKWTYWESEVQLTLWYTAWCSFICKNIPPFQNLKSGISGGQRAFLIVSSCYPRIGGIARQNRSDSPQRRPTLQVHEPF